MVMTLLLSLFVGCTDETTTYSLHCDLEAPVLSAISAAPGDTVVARTRPLTEVQDTVVSVGGTRAAISDLGRDECDACDECRSDAGCTSCSDCDECAADCATCDEWVSFVTPDLPLEEHPVTITNVHGTSGAARLLLTAPDTGASDSGASDSGASDSGASDSGASDSGGNDSGGSDSEE
jgi:hypothetical protein